MAAANSDKSKGKRTSQLVVRPLEAKDLEPAVAIDAAITGRIRRGFFERRLTAALDEPKRFIYVGAELDGALKGFALVHVQSGEFGVAEDVAVLDALGVDPQARGKGIGRALMARVDEVVRDKNIHEVQTQAPWNSHELLGFLEAAGFELAPRYMLDREVERAVTW
jgi:GNAT superfamily N-acetyltransferase